MSWATTLFGDIEKGIGIAVKDIAPIVKIADAAAPVILPIVNILLPGAGALGQVILTYMDQAERLFPSTPTNKTGLTQKKPYVMQQVMNGLTIASFLIESTGGTALSVPTDKISKFVDDLTPALQSWSDIVETIKSSVSVMGASTGASTGTNTSASTMVPVAAGNAPALGSTISLHVSPVVPVAR